MLEIEPGFGVDKTSTLSAVLALYPPPEIFFLVYPYVFHIKKSLSTYNKTLIFLILIKAPDKIYEPGGHIFLAF